MLEITESTSEEEKKTILEDAFDMIQGAPFSQIDFIKWRMKERDDQKHWTKREEGRFEVKEGVEEEHKSLQNGLSAYYQLVEEKVK